MGTLETDPGSLCPSSFSNLFYFKLCPSTAGNSPPPECSNFPRPLLSLSTPLPAAPLCDLSNHVLIFQMTLCPLSATLCFLWPIYCLSLATCPAHFHFKLVTYWTMPVTVVFFCFFLPDHGDTDFFLQHFPFHGSLACFKFLYYFFCKRPCLASICQ